MDASNDDRLRAYAALLDASPGFVAVADLSGRMLFVSAQGRSLVGLPDDVDVTRTTVADYLVGEVSARPVLRDWRDSSPLPVPMHTFPVEDPETGERFGTALVQRDLRQMRATAEAEAARTAYAESEQRHQAVLQSIGDLIIVVGRDGRLLYASPSTRRAIGVGAEEALDVSVMDLVHPEDRAMVADALARVIEQPGTGAPLLMRMLTSTGAVRHVEILANNLLDDPLVAGIVCVSRDITQRVQAEQAQAAQAQVLELIASEAPLDKVLSALAHWVEAQLHDTACSILLAEADPGQPATSDRVLRDAASPSMPTAYRRAVASWDESIRRGPCASALASGVPVLVRDLLSEQRWSPLHELARELTVRSCWSYPITSPATGEALGTFALYRGEPGLPDEDTDLLMLRASHLVGIAVDRQRLLERLAHQAHHDALTGLPNRVALLSRLTSALQDRDAGGPVPVVVFLDLDRLKVVNDSLGHEVGDELLVRVAQRLRRAVPPTDLVARFGGDEFVVLCSRADCRHDAQELVETVLRAIAEVVPLEGRQVTPTASAGVVVAGADQSATEVLRDADIAMYRAKHRRAGGYELFGEHMRQRAFDRLDLEAQIRSGIERGEFRLHYQPVVDLVDRARLVGFEALVRWQHPQRGLLGPGAFIALAEETGLILPLGDWVLRTAVATAVRWREHTGAGDVTLAVNLAAQQLAAPELAQAVRESVAALGSWSLALELTESTMMDDTVATRAVIEELAATGARLTIDDFGTGYSSLAYLTRLPVRTLKIDREFIGEIERRPAATVAAAIIGLGDDLGLAIVAEGVETEAQREVLTGLGCRFAQGYLLGHPVPEDEALALLQAGPR